MSWDALQFVAWPGGIRIRSTTLLAALLLFAWVLWRTRRPGVAYVVLSSWVSSYELLYLATGAALGRWAWLYVLAGSAGLGWVFFAWHLGHRPAWALLPAFAVLWGGWVIAGYHANDHAHITSWLQELANVDTKTWLAVVYACGRLPVRRLLTRRPHVHFEVEPAPALHRF